jgi:hypothetical protein
MSRNKCILEQKYKKLTMQKEDLAVIRTRDLLHSKEGVRLVNPKANTIPLRYEVAILVRTL